MHIFYLHDFQYVTLFNKVEKQSYAPVAALVLHNFGEKLYYSHILKSLLI